jgi:hypothetical protein
MSPRRWDAELLSVSLAILLAGSSATAGPSSPEAVVRKDQPAQLATRQRAAHAAPLTALQPLAINDPGENDAAGEATEGTRTPTMKMNLALALPVADTEADSILRDRTPVQNTDSRLWHPGLENDHLAAALPVTPSLSADPVGTSEQPMIPLPTAAWTGLSMLAGLGIIRFARNIRKFLT